MELPSHLSAGVLPERPEPFRDRPAIRPRGFEPREPQGLGPGLGPAPFSRPHVVGHGKGAAAEGNAGPPTLRIPAAFSRRALSVFLHGDAQELVDLVAWGLVSWIGSEFSWIDIRDDRVPPGQADVASRGLVPEHRLVVVDRVADMAPNSVGLETVHRVVRRGEPADTMAQLAEFVRLPRPVQLALARTTPGPRPAIMVVSHAERLGPPSEGHGLPRVVRELTGLGASVFYLFGSRPPPSRFAFDAVLRVAGLAADGWRSAALEFERPGPLDRSLEGQRVPLVDVEPLAHLLDRASPGSIG